MKNNLEQAGYTNIRIVPSSFLVRAMDKDGNPLIMVIDPDSVNVTYLSGDQGKLRSQGNQRRIKSKFWHCAYLPSVRTPVSFAALSGPAVLACRQTYPDHVIRC